jgi:hypothetical protein
MERTKTDALPRKADEPPEEVVARALMILEEESRSWNESCRRQAPPPATAVRDGDRT